MTLNKRSLNRDVVNDGLAASYSLSGNLISFKQVVVYQQSSSTTNLISFKQRVVNEQVSTNLISFHQQVTNDTSQIRSFLERNGWYPILTINGIRVADNLITDQIDISIVEADNALMSFSLLPGIGVQDLDSYQGKQVALSVIKQANPNVVTRVYTGFINKPEIDLIRGCIKFNCSSMRDEYINSFMASPVYDVGYYSTDAFGYATDRADELEKRLSTVPLSLDYNAYGGFGYTNYLAQGVADYTLTDDDVKREGGYDPTIDYAIRSTITNTVSINVTYNFQRTYHRQRSFTWDPAYGSTCNFLTKGHDVARRDLIAQAVESAGWPVRGEINYTPVLPAGYYYCSGYIGWATGTVTGQNVAVTDADGNQVNDSAGKPLYRTVQTGAYDVALELCFGATWAATTRFTQNISHSYNLLVTAPQSVTQFGTVSQTETIGVESQYDSSDWENYTQYKAPPSEYPTIPAQPASNYYIDRHNNLSGFYNAIYTVLNKANTTLIKSHRTTKVNFYKELWPEISLAHTVALDTDRLTCKGKVYTINHKLDFTTGEAYTQVTLALSKATGSASNSALVVPAMPTYSPAVEGSGVHLQSHYGEVPNVFMNGFIANRWVTTNTNIFKTQYPISFVVDVPGIENAVRGNITLPATASYTTAIQNDDLTPIFTGKS